MIGVGMVGGQEKGWRWLETCVNEIVDRGWVSEVGGGRGVTEVRHERIYGEGCWGVGGEVV